MARQGGSPASATPGAGREGTESSHFVGVLSLQADPPRLFAVSCQSRTLSLGIMRYHRRRRRIDLQQRWRPTIVPSRLLLLLLLLLHQNHRYVPTIQFCNWQSTEPNKHRYRATSGHAPSEQLPAAPCINNKNLPEAITLAELVWLSRAGLQVHRLMTTLCWCCGLLVMPHPNPSQAN